MSWFNVKLFPPADAACKNSSIVNGSGSHVVVKRSSFQSSKNNRESDKLDRDWRISNVRENRARDNVMSPYSERSEHSKASGTSSLRRRSSNDLLESQSSYSHKSSSRMIDCDDLNRSHGEKSSNSMREVEPARRNAVEDGAQKRKDLSGRSSGSSRYDRSSTSVSDRKMGSNGSIRLEHTNEYVRGLGIYQNPDAEFRDRSRSSSAEKQQQKAKPISADTEVATSTPQKSSWPLSPIRTAVDLKVSLFLPFAIDSLVVHVCSSKLILFDVLGIGISLVIILRFLPEVVRKASSLLFEMLWIPANHLPALQANQVTCPRLSSSFL